MTKMKGTVCAPVFCRMPGNHQAGVKIVSVYEGMETSLYLTAIDIAELYRVYNHGPAVIQPAGKPRRRHV